MGLCRASTTIPLNEQGMAVKGERIRIALDERSTSINHSFDGSALGESFPFVFFVPRVFRGIAMILEFDRELQRMD